MKEKQITIWVTQPTLPDNATFARWGIWLHHQGETLSEMARVMMDLDTNLPDLNPCLYHVRFSRWVLENVSIGKQGIQDGDIFVLVTQEEDKEPVAAYIETAKPFPENIPSEVALHRNFITMQDVDEWLRNHGTTPSISTPGGTIIYRPEGSVTMTSHHELDVKSPGRAAPFTSQHFLL